MARAGKIPPDQMSRYDPKRPSPLPDPPPEGVEKVVDFALDSGRIVEISVDDVPLKSGSDEYRRALEEFARIYGRPGGVFGRAFLGVGLGGPSTTSTEDPQTARERREREAAENKERELREDVERFLVKTEHHTAWDDIVGNEHARRAMIEAIEHPITHAKIYARYGKRPAKGILLLGPPGCGKTMFGKAAAAVLARLHKSSEGPTMLHVKAPELQSEWLGVTERLIRKIFAYARAWSRVHHRPLTIFIDEADAILPSRDHAYHWEISNVSTFLTEMDGMESSGALIILATNRPHAIDQALLRDGRVDRKIRVERPDREGARIIAARALADVPSAIAPDELATALAESLFADHRIIAALHHGDGRDWLRMADVVSGAMVVGLVEAAKGNAMVREVAGAGPAGVALVDIDAAIDTAVRENTGLHHGYAVAEWCHRHKIRDVTVEPIRHLDPPA